MSHGFESERRRAARRGYALLCVACGAALGVLVMVLGAPSGRDAHPEPAMLIGAASTRAPEQAPEPTARRAAPDAAVQASQVSDEPEAAGMSIGAYER